MTAKKKNESSGTGGLEEQSTPVKTGKCNNKENPLLKWNNEQSPETLQKIRSKAGIASGAARRAKGDLVGKLRKALDDNPEAVVDILMQILKDDSRPTLQLKAAELVFKVAGLMSESVTIKQDQPFVTLDLSTMSDADLIQYADQQIVDADN